MNQGTAAIRKTEKELDNYIYKIRRIRKLVNFSETKLNE